MLIHNIMLFNNAFKIGIESLKFRQFIRELVAIFGIKSSCYSRCFNLSVFDNSCCTLKTQLSNLKQLSHFAEALANKYGNVNFKSREGEDAWLRAQLIRTQAAVYDAFDRKCNTDNIQDYDQVIGVLL